jgi:hypothetical protein
MHLGWSINLQTIKAFGFEPSALSTTHERPYPLPSP